MYDLENNGMNRPQFDKYHMIMLFLYQHDIPIVTSYSVTISRGQIWQELISWIESVGEVWLLYSMSSDQCHNQKQSEEILRWCDLYVDMISSCPAQYVDGNTQMCLLSV